MTDLEMDSWELENEDAWDSLPSGTPSPEPITPRKRKRGEDGPPGLYVSMLDAEERQKQEEIDKQLALSIRRDPKNAGWRKREHIQHKTATKAEKREDDIHRFNLPLLADLRKQEREDLRKEGSSARKITAFAKVLEQNTTFTESTARQIYFQNIVGVMFAYFADQDASLELTYTVVQFIEEF